MNISQSYHVSQLHSKDIRIHVLEVSTSTCTWPLAIIGTLCLYRNRLYSNMTSSHHRPIAYNMSSQLQQRTSGLLSSRSQPQLLWYIIG